MKWTLLVLQFVETHHSKTHRVDRDASDLVIKICLLKLEFEQNYDENHMFRRPFC